MNIAIIPARGGSRRIPRKNIKKFNGKPIIYWSIKCALQTKLFDQVIVSTDDKDIARLSKKFGAKVPFMRPTNLSHNSVGIIKVISSAVKWIVKNENKIKYVCCIFPTSPLMKAKDIQLGYKKIVKNKLSYVFSGASYPSSIYRSFSLDKNNKNLKICFKKKFNKKKNLNLKFFYDAGQFYWGTKEAWVKKRNIFSSKSAILEIPRWRTQDINDNKDWITAQNLFKGIKKNEKK